MGQDDSRRWQLRDAPLSFRQGGLRLGRHAPVRAHPEAIPLLEKITDHARRTLAREPKTVTPSHNTEYYGLPQEWYTLSENQYRAWQATRNPMFKEFAEAWHYPQYWNKF